MSHDTHIAGPAGPFSPPDAPLLTRMTPEGLSVAYFEPVTDEEREAFIARCGAEMHACYVAGNREAADNWMHAMNEAIAGRSPAQVLRMESCYFAEMGERDRAAAEASA